MKLLSCVWFFAIPLTVVYQGDSPGKNTGVGAMLSSRGCSQPRDQNQVYCIALHCRWILLPAELSRKPKNTEVGRLPFLQGVFLTQELNQGLPHCRWILYQLSHKGSPIILEWVVYPFSRGSSWPRNWAGESCIAGGFFTHWAMRQSPEETKLKFPRVFSQWSCAGCS